MLNNEFVNQQAKVWANRLLANSKQPATKIIRQAWYELFGRPPSDQEVSILSEFADEAKDNDDAPKLDKATLTQICHVLLNSKEFMFLR